MDKGFKRLPTETSNSFKDVKNISGRVNTFKHVVHGSSIVNHNMDDLRCKVPVSFKFLKPPNKSPTGSFKPQHQSETSTGTQYCLTSPDQEPRKALRKAFNTIRSSAITSATGGRNNNHISNRFKAYAGNPRSLQLQSKSNSNSPVVNINTSLNCCQKCNKQVKDIVGTLNSTIILYRSFKLREFKQLEARGTWSASRVTAVTGALIV